MEQIPECEVTLALSGAYRETQKGGGETEGIGRIMIEIKSFCKIHNKMSKSGGGEGPPPIFFRL